MKNVITGLAACGVLFVGMAASAQQTATGTPTATKRQMMKECMDRQVAKNDASTKSQMKKFCKAEIKTSMPVPKSTAPMTTAPESSDSAPMPADTPR